MKEEQLKGFKEVLLARKERILSSISNIQSDIKDTHEKGADPIDVASKVEERNRLVSDLSREELSLSRVNFSIRNFEEFGYCIDCGEDINIKRLEIDPTNTRCIDCQEIKEIKTKQG